MKDTVFTLATKEVIEVTMKALDEVIKEDIEVLANIGNPEKLIGKKYEEWTPEDKQALGQVYGPEPNALSRFIFRKEYPKLLELEEEAKIG